LFGFVQVNDDVTRVLDLRDYLAKWRDHALVVGVKVKTVF
jgi:hypothetical protein